MINRSIHIPNTISNHQKCSNLSIVKLHPHPSISSKMSSNQKSDTSSSSSSSSSNTDKVYHHPKFGSCVKLHAGNYNQWQLQNASRINVSSKQPLSQKPLLH